MNEEPVVASKSGKKNLRIYVGALVVVAVIAYLVGSGLKGATAPYLSVPEVRALAAEDQARLVRVTGIVVGSSIQFDAQAPLLRFELAGEGETLPVTYSGAKPDMLQDAADCSIEGKVGTDGVFRATQLFLKCPSKYEAKATEQAGS